MLFVQFQRSIGQLVSSRFEVHLLCFVWVDRFEGSVCRVHGFSEPTDGAQERAVSYGISDNDRKYYSLERAREVLDYDPQDNSAEH